MGDELAKAGLYLDDLDRVRILEPAVYRQANDLKDNCKAIDENTKDLRRTVGSLITTLSDLGDAVDKERMIAIGLRNSIESAAKDRETRRRKLQALVGEKTAELERLQSEHHSLQLVDVEQRELIDYLSEMR